LVIGLKFCGGCNPVIDRSALVQEIRKLLSPVCKMETEQSAEPWEKAVLVCGCPTACADKPTLRSLAKQWIRVSGQMIDFEGVPEDQMAAIIARKIQT
jgi:3-hydroxyacyl-[acyl-carrier-protein] dehydratase